MTQKTLLIFLLVIVVASLGYFWVRSGEKITQEKACTLEAKLCPDGSAVGRVSPSCDFAPCPRGEQTVPPAEKSAAQSATYKDLLMVETPSPESTISSPLFIRGKARGNWYFEASFPVVLTDWDGRIIAQGTATAEGDWMTTDFVPFTAKLSFAADTTVSNKGSLILQKSNPSGLPEKAEALEIPVYFEK